MATEEPGKDPQEPELQLAQPRELTAAEREKLEREEPECWAELYGVCGRS